MSKIFKILVLSIMLVTSNITYAEDTTQPDASAEVQYDVANFEYQKIRDELDLIENNLKNNNFTRQTLDDTLNNLSERDMELSLIIQAVEKMSKYAQASLDALGEAPTENGVEDESITKLREEYTATVNGYKEKIIKANLLKSDITRINAIVGEVRGRMLIGNLVSEPKLITDPKVFFKAMADGVVFLLQVAYSPIEWYSNLDEVAKEKFQNSSLYVLLILALAFSLGLFLRSYIIRHWGYLRHIDDVPRYGQKIVVAIATAIAYGVIPSLIIGGCLLWQVTDGTLNEANFGKIIACILFYGLIMIFIRAISRVILAPWNGKWRLFSISDERAEKIFSAVTFSIVLLGIMYCLNKISTYYEISSELSLLLDVSMDIAKALSIIIITARIFSQDTSKDEDNEEGSDENNDEAESMSSSAKVIFFVTLFASITLGVSFFGYPGLATYIFDRFFLSIILIAAFMILRAFISDLLRRSIVFWISTFKLRKRLLSKADFFMSLLVTPVLAMLFLYSLLSLWGVPGKFMLNGLKKLVFGFKVGGIQISLLAIATGLLVFLVSITIVRILKTRLSNNLLNRINMDEGTKHSLISGFSFIGFIIACILAIVAMGVDLSNLAVIAGALSVGIGFGLQDVIKNLVSGIIILFERPFKVGDWVIINGDEGKIKQINIRSTELETWTRQSVIIPNATLISSSLVNLTHNNNWQRQTIAVGVSYDADAEMVTKLLLECVRSCKKVAKVPAPYVIFKDFGSSSLDFEVRFYISDIWNSWNAGSDIRYEILKRFREENINIAYPQLVIHKGSQDTSIKGWQTNV